MPTISLVIRCYNEEKHLGKLLDWVARQTVPAEVVVVDSGSTDRTVAIAQAHGAKLVHIAPQEFTFGRALNWGLAAASGELAVLASAHVYPTSERWLELLAAPLATPAVALSYGGQVGNAQTKFSEHQIFRKWFPPGGEWYGQDHPFCNNANACVRRSVWAHLPYAEALTGLEDLDWAKRALAAGHQLAYVPTAQVVHVHDETPARIQNRYRREAIAYRRIFPEARFSLGDFLLLLPTNVLSDWAQAGREGSFWRHAASICQFRYRQFWGTYQGYRQRGEVSDMLKRRFYYPNKLREGWRFLR
jgi:rhamnosyltransferase